MSSSQPLALLQLPTEILINIFLHLTTPSFIQTVTTCHQLFDLAASSREVALYHLQLIPGIKIGLEDLSLSTSVLFRILRQRASANLYGANLSADCRDLRFRNGSIDPSASCLTDATDDLKMSLVMKESLTVRHFGTEYSLKEHTPPYARGLGKVLQVVHWKSTISILYESQAYHAPPCSSCTVSSSFHTPSLLGGAGDGLQDTENHLNEKLYHLAQYNAYTTDYPDVFQIPPCITEEKRSHVCHFSPVHLAVYNRLKCAILWDEPSKRHSKRPHSEIVLYTADRIPGPWDEGCYRPTNISTRKRTRDSEDSEDEFEDRTEKYLSRFRPRSIAFVEGGRRLKLYRAGSITPYAVLTAKRSDRGLSSALMVERTLTNEVRIWFNEFHIDSAFYGQHVFNVPLSADNAQSECSHIYLHLATAKIVDFRLTPLDIAPAHLCIVQSRKTTGPEDCDHVVDLDNHGTVHFNNLTVVARLWGWGDALRTNSSMTGLDTVCISPKGTRIAIACWDRILVWALDPGILCEEWISERRLRRYSSNSSVNSSVNVSVQGDAPVTSAQGDNNGSPSDAASDAGWSNSDVQNNNEQTMIRSMVRITRFYDLVDNPLLGEIVELKPIVLKLPGGAIARKMMWNSSTNEEDFDDFAEDVVEPSPPQRQPDSLNLDLTPPLSTMDENEHAFASGARRPFSDSMDNNNNIPAEGTEVNERKALSSIEKEQIKSVGEKLEQLVNDTVELDSCIVWDKTIEESRIVVESEEATQPNSQPLTNHPICARLSDIAEEDDQEGEKAKEDEQKTEEQEGRDPQSQAQPSTSPSSLDPRQQASEASALTGHQSPSDPHRQVITPPPLPPGSPSYRAHTARNARSQSTHSDYSYPFRPKCDSSYGNRKVKRQSEDELVVLTDRGVQVWNLGVWGRGRREREWLDEKLP